MVVGDAGGQYGAGVLEGLQAEVAALLGPLVVLFGQDRPDQSDDRVAVGEDAHDVGAAADLPVEALVGVVGPDLTPDLLGEDSEREDLLAGGLEVGRDLRELVVQAVQDPVELGIDGVGVVLVLAKLFDCGSPLVVAIRRSP